MAATSDLGTESVVPSRLRLLYGVGGGGDGQKKVTCAWRVLVL